MQPSEINLQEFVIETDKKRFQEYDLYLKNYDKCLAKEEDFLISVIKQKNDDEEHCEALRKKIEETNKELKNLGLVITNRENENKQILAEINQVEEMLKERWGDNPETTSHRKNFSDEDEASEKNEKLLKDTYKIIKLKIQLYQKYLGCTVNFEEPDIFAFSFLSNDHHSKGLVKFRFNNSKWEILNFEPEELLSKDDIEEFKYINDTQKLLSRLLIK